MIRVLLVDDSLTVRQALRAVLERDPDVHVVGEANDGGAVLGLVTTLRPDVVVLDMVMPGTNGVVATEQIMAHCPTPILIVSSSVNRGEMFDTYAALAAGAVDVLDKAHAGDEEWDRRFVAAVRMVSRIKVITHPRGRLGAIGRARSDTSQPSEIFATAPDRRQPRLVALGASTGGPGALATVLRSISRDYPIPIAAIVHIDGRFATALAEWLAGQTKRDVRFARDGELVAGGAVSIAPPDCHLTIAGGRYRLVEAPPRNHCRPSIDVLFESAAVEYGARIAACLLTGMGRDGAAGMLAVRNHGGFTIAQDEATSVIYGMPREAMVRGAVERELPLDQIGPAIESLRGHPT